MRYKLPFIYPFQTYGGCYIYDVNMDTIVSVEDETFKYLYHQQFGEAIQADENVIRSIESLRKSGFLKSDRPEIIEHPDTDLVSSILNKNLNHLVLQVTQGCNLRCAYCAYSNHYENRKHSAKHMSWEMARDAIDFLIDHSVHSESIILGFYGGEPLLEFDLVKKCMEYATKEAEGKNISFAMTTNATLLTEDIIKVLEKYKVSLSISLDGPEEVHDKNRRFSSGEGSFDRVVLNVRKIKENFPDYFKHIHFNMVFDKQNECGLINDFIKNSDIVNKYTANVSTVSNLYVKEEFIEETEEIMISSKMELLKILLSKLGKIDDKEFSLFEKEYIDMRSKLVYSQGKRTGFPQKSHPGGPCTPGRKKVFMNTDGKFYPCERVSENSETMKIGNLYDGFDLDRVKDIINVGKLTEEECKNCWAYSHCIQCAAYADDLNGLSRKERLSNCNMTKSTVAAMFYNYCMLKEFGYVFSSSEDQSVEELIL